MNLEKVIQRMQVAKPSKLRRFWWCVKDKFWYDPIMWITIKWEMLCRMCYYGWHMRNSYDFDGHTVYHMLYLKLERMQKTMSTHGHTVWTDGDTKLMRKLQEAKIIAYKLNNSLDFHAMKFMHKYKTDDRSWFGSDLFPNAKLIDHKLYSYMLKKAWDKDYNYEKFLKTRLYYLLQTYLDQWWD